MIATLAQFALALALLLSVVGAVLGYGVAYRGSSHAIDLLLQATRRTVGVITVLVSIAFVALIVSFVLDDFTVRNVAENSNTRLTVFYKIAASWGSHEGSFLLWVLMYCCWTQAVVRFGQTLHARFKVRVLATMLLVLVGFLAYLLLASNPFEYLSPAPLEGRDLNPLLQDVIMIIHPPMLYMGYVGFAVSFAFAVAGLIEGRLDATWARQSRPWANLAWAFLTVGIALGSWWAYRELGWGGWWFWDPVENASLMPWLAGTALIHSLAVTEKRGVLRSWTILLSLSAFALSLLGTFLVRSGVLTSVHAFATDPARGVFILVLLLLVVGGSYVLFALRAGQVGQGTGFTASGRESLLLSNNVLMSAALVTVMLGTLYPLAVEVLGGRKMSVGQPYFEATFAPVLLPALFLMAFGPDSRWRSTPWGHYIKPGAVAFALALGVMVGFMVFQSHFSVVWGLGILASVFLAAAKLFHVVRALVSAAPAHGLWFRARQLGWSYWGMVLAHLGVAVFVLGVTWVKAFETEQDAVMKAGQHQQIGGWDIQFKGIDAKPRNNHVAVFGVFEITRDGQTLHLVKPEKRRYFSSDQIMTEAAIHTHWFSDLYISLGEPIQHQDGTEAWGVRLYYKPLINLIWWGCALMALGGLVTVLDRRYRIKNIEIQ